MLRKEIFYKILLPADSVFDDFFAEMRFWHPCLLI